MTDKGMAKTNAAKIAKSGFWLTSSFAVERTAQLVAQIILARLLSPEEFGIWAMVLLITRLSEQFKETATTSVLIYRGLEDRKLANAVYSLAIDISLAMFALQVIAGFFVARFFDQPLVWQLNACAALVFVIGAGSGSHGAVLQRQMRFKQLAIAETGAGIARFGTAILCASMGLGVWSFAFGEVAMITVVSIMRRSFSNYSFQYYLKPDARAVKEIRGYISHIIGVNLAVYANTNSDNLIIGKLVSTTALGFYNVAYQLAMLPTFALSRINQINFSVLSQRDKDGKKAYLCKILEIYALIYALVYGLGFTVSPWLIPFVYGEEWQPAVILFQIVLLFAYARGFMAILGTTLNALNKPDVNAAINWLLVPLSIPAFLLGAKFGGVQGVATAAALVMGIGATIWFWLATARASGWSIATLIKPVIVPTAAMIISLGIVSIIPFSASLQILVKPILLVTFYSLSLWILSKGRLPFSIIKMVKEIIQKDKQTSSNSQPEDIESNQDSQVETEELVYSYSVQADGSKKLELKEVINTKTQAPGTNPVVCSNTNRLFFLDFLKAISIVAVVSFHSIFVPVSTYENSIQILDTLFAPLRFCVPIFLTISILLWERGINNKDRSKSSWLFWKKRLTRLAIPLGFWFSIAALLKLVKGNSLEIIIQEIFTGEIFTGAYYLLILFQLIPIFILVRNKLKKLSYTILAIVLQFSFFVFMYLAQSEVMFSQLIPNLEIINRPFFIYWLAYIPIGIYFAHNLESIQRISAGMNLKLKTILLSVLCIFFWVDYSALSSLNNSSVALFDYLTLSTIISVPVLFLCCASIKEKQVSPKVRQIIQTLSRYSLGIFCINGVLRLIFLSLGSSWFNENTFNLPTIVSLKIVGWITLLIVSLWLSKLLDKIGLKSVVR